MMDSLTVSLLLGYAILIWLRTDAFAEYMALLGVNWFKLDEYRKLKTDGYSEDYVSFLYEYYQNHFFVRLVACPVCLSFWLGSFSIVFLGSLDAVIVAPLSLFFYLHFSKLL